LTDEKTEQYLTGMENFGYYHYALIFRRYFDLRQKGGNEMDLLDALLMALDILIDD